MLSESVGTIPRDKLCRFHMPKPILNASKSCIHKAERKKDLFYNVNKKLFFDDLLIVLNSKL